MYRMPDSQGFQVTPTTLMAVTKPGPVPDSPPHIGLLTCSPDHLPPLMIPCLLFPETQILTASATNLTGSIASKRRTGRSFHLTLLTNLLFSDERRGPSPNTHHWEGAKYIPFGVAKAANDQSAQPYEVTSVQRAAVMLLLWSRCQPGDS